MIRLAYAAKELHLLLGLRLGLSLASLLQLLIPFASPLALTAGAIVIGDAQLGAQYITGIRISCVQLTKSGSYPFVGIGYTGGENPSHHICYIYTKFDLLYTYDPGPQPFGNSLADFYWLRYQSTRTYSDRTAMCPAISSCPAYSSIVPTREYM